MDLKKKWQELKWSFASDVLVPMQDDRQVMKSEKILGTWFALVPLCLLVYFFVFHGLNYVYNFATHLGGFVLDPEVQKDMYSWTQAFVLRGRPLWFLLMDFALAVGLAGFIAYKIRFNYTSLDAQEKGSARWTTLKEIREQYKAIPDGHCGDSDTYPGGGGVPVCRYGDTLFIDNSPVNNLIIGITRSGKGEMFVFPMIDIYSRAEEKASLVVADPKLELYANSFDTLKRRGYDVMCLNLVDPIKSMGYNPLQLIIEAYKQENYDDAEMLANTFAYSIFMSSGNQSQDKFWSIESANLLVAVILATIEDCLKEDQHENVERLQRYRELRKMWEKLDASRQKAIRQQIEHLQQEIEAERDRLTKQAQEQPHLPSSQGEEYYRNATKKLWTERVYEFEGLPPEVEFVETDTYERQITMYSIVNTMTELARMTDSKTGASALDDYFAARPVGDRGKLKYSAIEVAGDQTKGSIFASCLAELVIFTYNDIAKMTARTEFDLKQVGFGDKPLAIFLGIPDYDQSNHFIASVFIRQLYFTLAKQATNTRSGKCKREVIFLLDEFGNLPPIEGMASIITVCLGRNIRFDLVIQSYAQIEEKYDKGADTIIGNCGNQIYILTNDKQTAENYSALIGNETVLTASRSGQRFSLDKSVTESYSERPLLNSNELMQLQVGDCVVARVMQRQDLSFGNVSPTPIYNHKATKFKYRWQYLQTDDPTNHIDEKKARKLSSEPDNGKAALAKEGRMWVFPSFNTVDDIAYDERVKNTRMENITFDIYHFCAAVMDPYVKEGALKQKHDTLVSKSKGREYAQRHTFEKVTQQRLEALPAEDRQQVHRIMAPYLSGVQEDDPLFRKYTFEDCKWKTYTAYLRGLKGDKHSGISPQEFEMKFSELAAIFDSADSEKRELLIKNYPKAMDFLNTANSLLLSKQRDKAMQAAEIRSEIMQDEELDEDVEFDDYED